MEIEYYEYDRFFEEAISFLDSIDDKLEKLLELQMDKKIKKLEKDTKKVLKQESALLKEDKKRDKFVDAGRKALKNK